MVGSFTDSMTDSEERNEGACGMCIDYLLSLNRVSEARYERADVIDYWSHLVIENEERIGRADVYVDVDGDVDFDVDVDVDV